MRLVLQSFLCYTEFILNADSLKAVIRLFSPEAGGRPALEAAMSSVRFLKSCPGSGRDPFFARTVRGVKISYRELFSFALQTLPAPGKDGCGGEKCRIFYGRRDQKDYIVYGKETEI